MRTHMCTHTHAHRDSEKEGAWGQYAPRDLLLSLGPRLLRSFVHWLVLFFLLFSLQVAPALSNRQFIIEKVRAWNLEPDC